MTVSNLRKAARHERDNKDWIAAEKAWIALLESAPGDLEGVLGLADALRRLKRFEEAEAALQTLPRAISGSKQVLVPLARVAFGRASTDNAWLNAAIDRWLAILEVDSEDFESHLRLGILYGLQSNLSEARRYLLKAELITPNHTDLILPLTKIHLATNNIDDAYKVFKKRFGRNGSVSPLDNQTLVAIAHALFRQGRISEAEDVLLSVDWQSLSTFPSKKVRFDIIVKKKNWLYAMDELTAWKEEENDDIKFVDAVYSVVRNIASEPILRRIILNRLRSVIHDYLDVLAKRAQADDLLELALEILHLADQSELSTGRIGRADVQAALYLFDDAIHNLSIVLNHTPENTTALHLLAEIYARQGQVSCELSVRSKIEAISPNDESNLVKQASALVRSGRMEEAENILLNAVQGYPEYSIPFFELGLLYQRSGQYNLAEAFFSEVVKLEPSNEEALFYLGQIRILLKQENGAQAALISCLKCCPWHIDALLALRALEKNRSDGHWASHVADVKARLTKLDVEWRFLATVELEVSGFGSALEIFNAAQIEHPYSVKLGIAHAFTLRTARQYQAALDTVNAVLALQPSNSKARRERLLILCESGRFSEAAEWVAANETFFQSYETRQRGIGLLTHFYLGINSFREAFTVYRQSIPSEALCLQLPEGMYKSSLEDLSQESCLILAAWGLGDEICWSRIYGKLGNILGNPIIACSPRLKSLFTRSYPNIKFVSCERNFLIPEFPNVSSMRYYDCLPSVKMATVMDNKTWAIANKCESVSLVTDLLADFYPCRNAFADNKPFLSVDTERQSLFRRQLSSLGCGLKIGISWTSLRVTPSRSVYLTSLIDWLPVLGIRNNIVVCLQPGDVDSELNDVETRSGCSIYRISGLDLEGDLDGVASLMSSLDLVISIVNTVSELAGAIGVPNWIINTCSTLDWRVADADGTDLLNPSSTHFRVDPEESKEKVFVRVAERLGQMSAKSS